LPLKAKTLVLAFKFDHLAAIIQYSGSGNISCSRSGRQAGTACLQ
jgi:hypothetical protein